MKYLKLFERKEDFSNMEVWKTRSYNSRHNKQNVVESDMYFTYRLRPEQIDVYLNKWFVGGQFFGKNGQVYTDEVITLKETDEETSSHLYHQKFNPVSIRIMCPIGAKFQKNKNGKDLYNMKAQIHSIDDSSYAIWWEQLPIDELRNIRKNIMSWINPNPLHPTLIRYNSINGEEFLNKCVEFGADENTKDYD